MKNLVVFGVLAIVALAAAVLVAAVMGQSGAAPDLEGVLNGTAGLVETIAGSDVRFLQQVYVLSTWANGVYLTQAMPFTITAVAGAILALGLGLAMVAVAFRLGGRDE